MASELDLTPDPRFRRNLDYSRRSQLIVPGATPQRPRQELMEIECPKCKHLSSAPVSRNPMICMADTPPHVGEGRGCGWLLGLDLPINGSKRGRAFAVIDLKLGRISEAESKQLMYKGFRMVTNHWIESGKLRLIIDDDGRVVGKEWVE